MVFYEPLRDAARQRWRAAPRLLPDIGAGALAGAAVRCALQRMQMCDGSPLADAASCVRACARSHLRQAVVVTNPLWVLKTRLQTATSASEPLLPAATKASAAATATAAAAAPPRRDVTLSALVRREGARALYRGVTPALLLVSYNALQLPLYSLARAEGTPTLPAVFASVSVASALTYPLQLIRTRFQAERVGAAAAAAGQREYTSFGSVRRHAARLEGGALRGLYKGFTPHLLRSVLGWSVRFAVAEAVADAAGGARGGGASGGGAGPVSQ
jgi:hypothetical protein